MMEKRRRQRRKVKVHKRIMIQYLRIAFILCLSCLTLRTTGYAKTSQNTSAVIMLSESKHVIKKGGRLKLKAIIQKSGYKRKKIIWSSNRKKVAAVSAKGLVKARKKGTAIITARIKGTGYKARCKVIVGTPVKKISFPDTHLRIKEGDSTYLKADIYPRKATLKKLTYTAGDKTIVTVSKSGKILGLKPGTTRIKVASQDGNHASAKVTVTVYRSSSDTESTGSMPDDSINKPNQGNPEEGSDQYVTDETSEQGHIDEGSTQGKEDTVSIFMRLMKKYSAFIKSYGEYFYKSKTATVTSYQEAYDSVVQGNSVGINCASPINWALMEMGLISSGQIYGTGSGFVIKGPDTKTRLYEAADFLDNSPAIGFSVQEASEQSYLQSGDILSMVIDGSRSHTLVYIGLSEDGHAMVYEAGNIPYSLSYTIYGCGPLDYYEKKNYIITGVMRLK